MTKNLPNEQLSLPARARQQIEAVYQRPLAELSAATDLEPMLGAALDIYERLRLADHSVQFQTGRLRDLVAVDHQIGDFDVSHIHDCAQRLAQAHAARSAHVSALTALLNALPGQGPRPAAPPVPVAARARTATAPTR